MSRRLASLAVLALTGALGLAPDASAAGQSWVKGDVLLNVRTGPGLDNRVLGAITTGDPVDVIEHSNGWTHVRSADAGEGWIPSGFLQDEPPAVVRLEKAESEAAQLRQRVEELAAEAERLRAAHAEIEAREADRSREIQRLSEENASLRADVIWPVLIAGAAILLTGGMLGAWMRGGGRRATARVRL
jgi:SH3 domain protein